MKILYINSNTLNQKSADIKQSMNTVNTLSGLCDINFYSSWINKKDIADLEFFFNLKIKFKHNKAPVIINTKYFLLEKLTRFIFCLFIIIHLYLNKYDVVFTMDFSFLYFLSLMPGFLKPKIKIIFEAHKIYHKASKKVNFNQEKRSLNQADLFITNSGGTKKGLIDFFNIPDNKILVLHNGVDIKNFKKQKPDYNFLKKEYEINKNVKIIIYTGSFLPWKGVEYLVYAFNYIKDKNVKLLLIGGSGEDKERIEKLTLSSKNKKNIVIRSFINQQELIKLLSISKIAILPNNLSNEGVNYTSPLKAFEYLAMGLPVVASRLPSMMEIFKERVNCLFFTPEDPKDLANKIKILLKDKSLCMNISKNNLNKSKEYSWENRSKKLINFIKEDFK